MKKYKVIRVLDNKLLSEWTSDFADEKYYEMNWGKPEHQKELTPRLVIHHEEIPAVEYQAPVDAVLDENGIEISPAISEVLAVEAVEAYVEIVEATYETIPSEYVVEIEDYVAPLADISPRQIAYALLSMGITESQVIAAINQLPSPQKEQGVIAWNRSNYFVRTEPAVAMIGALMSLSNEQLDNIWKLGITL